MTKLIYTALLVLFLAPMTFAQAPDAETPKDGKADCEPIEAKLKEAKAQHDADHKAKGKAYYNWKKYYKQLHSESYLNTDSPIIDSVKKCETDENPGKDFCKGVMKKYNEISPKEKSAKEELTAAEAKSNESRKNYNLLLAEANEMNCLVKQ